MHPIGPAALAVVSATYRATQGAVGIGGPKVGR